MHRLGVRSSCSLGNNSCRPNIAGAEADLQKKDEVQKAEHQREARVKLVQRQEKWSTRLINQLAV